MIRVKACNRPSKGVIAVKCAGVVPLSLVDVPGHPAVTLFTPGCNLRCPYCHNPELVVGRPRAGLLAWPDVLQWLARRKRWLDWVCVSGGEPTLQPDLEEGLRQLRALGYRIKLDSNGSRPDRLEAILRQGLVDYLAMDAKTIWERYPELGGDGTAVARSAAAVRRWAADYEFRTTVVPPFVDEAVLLALAERLAGSRRWVLQQFIPAPTLLDPAWSTRQPYPDAQLLRWAEALAPIFGAPVAVRNLTGGTTASPDRVAGGS